MLDERHLLRGQLIQSSDLISLRDWFPVTIDGGQIAWRYFPGRFSEPFFENSLQQQDHAQRQLCYSSVDWLDRLEPAFAPSAFVFHTSRCGSTLLTQLLATLPSCIVMSEPPIIDAFLRWHHSAPDAAGGGKRLRQLILALGQRRSFDESHFVIKLDSWHIHHLPLVRAAFPDTPCWFLYRQPDAILASHQRQRGLQMVPGMVASVSMPTLVEGDLDGYCADVLEGFFQAALEFENALNLLHYQQLPDAIWEQLLPHIGFDCSLEQLTRMRQRSGFHAKHHINQFQSDPAPSMLHSTLQGNVVPLYQMLEQRRQNKSQ